MVSPYAHNIRRGRRGSLSMAQVIKMGVEARWYSSNYNNSSFGWKGLGKSETSLSQPYNTTLRSKTPKAVTLDVSGGFEWPWSARSGGGRFR